jgi:hypothetical protein
MAMPREYHREYSRQYYHKRKQDMIDKLGGKCAICGSTNNLQFDHVDAYSKSFSIGKLLNYSKKTVEAELSKCQLLCCDCHLHKSKVDISNKMKGPNNAYYGKHGKDHPSSRPVVDLDTGDEYESATEYARIHNLKPGSVSTVCRDVRRSVHGHRVAYKDNIK